MKNHLKKIKEDFKYQPKTEKSFKDFLIEMRNLKEKKEKETGDSKKTIYDERKQQDRFLQILPSDVVVEFSDDDDDIPGLEVYDNLVIWGGRINNVFNFYYQVGPDKNTSFFDFEFLDGFDPKGESADDSNEYVEKQMDLFNRVKNYYNEFSNYWRENLNI